MPDRAGGLGLRGLVINFEPAGVRIPKPIPQIGDLISGHRIGMGLQQGLKGVLNNLEVDLLSSCFSMAVTPNKTASVLPNRIAVKPYAKAPAAWRCSPRSAAPRRAVKIEPNHE